MEAEHNVGEDDDTEAIFLIVRAEADHAELHNGSGQWSSTSRRGQKTRSGASANAPASAGTGPCEGERGREMGDGEVESGPDRAAARVGTVVAAREVVTGDRREREVCVGRVLGGGEVVRVVEPREPTREGAGGRQSASAKDGES